MEMPEGWKCLKIDNQTHKDKLEKACLRNPGGVYGWKQIEDALNLMKEMCAALEAAKNELVPLARFSAMPPRSVSKINETLKKFKDWK